MYFVSKWNRESAGGPGQRAEAIWNRVAFRMMSSKISVKTNVAIAAITYIRNSKFWFDVPTAGISSGATKSIAVSGTTTGSRINSEPGANAVQAAIKSGCITHAPITAAPRT